jgi:NAD(P)-dependent dehydrogenase (short-subunit alcohol dehydrogenase family)
MTGKTILVTGSTDGIGRATARVLAEQGHRVLIHGRNREKGRTVLREIRDATGSDRLDLFTADLAEQQNIRDLADTVADACDHLDVLINNAGVFQSEREVAPGGIEMTFAVNFLAQVLLTHELLPLLEKSAPARIVNVASVAHRSVHAIDWENLPAEEDYDPYTAYAVSKVGVVAFTERLAALLEGTGVTVNCLHPEVIDTKLLRAYTGKPGGGAPPEQGAEVEIYVATSPGIEGMSGRYFERKQETPPSAFARNAGVQERFRDLGTKLTGIDRW